VLDDPETVYLSTNKAFEAGANGIVISREYEEMEVANLRAVGPGGAGAGKVVTCWESDFRFHWPFPLNLRRTHTMRHVRLIIRDARRDMHALRDEHFARCAAAALAAEPETIEELDKSMERFIVPGVRGQRSCFDGFSAGIGGEPVGTDVVIIDVPARLVVSDFLFLEEDNVSRAAEAEIDPFDSELGDAGDDDDPFEGDYPETYAGTPLRLSDDWQRTGDVAGWRFLAEARRRDRAANPPLDARAIVYGRPLVEFIARESWDAFRDRRLPIAEEKIDEQGEPAPWRLSPEEREEADLVRQIHIRWLMTPRDELRGKTPREVMVRLRAAISWDLNDRSMQWSHEGRCPGGLEPESAAYRYAGFGTHEWVTYYDMVRHLLWSCRDAVAERMESPGSAALTAGDFAAVEARRLAQVLEDWLDTPDPEFQGRTPRSIIHNERSRIPEGGSGAEAVVDCDCPLCQMQAEMPGPVFWGLDGCNMDDDFAFSFHATLAEWEEEQREHEEFSRKFAAREEERKRLGVGYDSNAGGMWQCSYSDAEAQRSPLMRLFSIGSHLAELISDLKEPHRDRELPKSDRELVDQLSRDFGNLREVAGACEAEAAEELIEPVVERFCRSLDFLAGYRPDLDGKSNDLQEQLRGFLEPGPAIARDSDDLPF
jgi:hypothetical protein